MMRIVRKFRKPIAMFFIVTFLGEFVNIGSALAITGHSSMPEYRSFEPVATTNMVNNFSGDFTYNVPLMEVPNGYPISLSYHSSDVNNESQASWVGLGWTLNPGAINRVKRGFPDEFNGQEVTYHSKMPKNWTITASAGGSLEIFGGEKLSIDADASIRYNNYNGVGTSLNTGFSAIGGVASLNMNYSQGRVGFSPSVNPMRLIDKFAKKKSKKSDDQAEADKKLDTDEKSGSESKKTQELSKTEKAADASGTSSKGVSFSGSIGGFGGGFSNGDLKFSVSTRPARSFPVAVTPYIGASARISFDAGLNLLPAPIDPEGRVSGTYSEQNYQESQTVPVYGYMHLEEAENRPDAMMDYFTEKEKMFEKRDANLGIPMPNNDMFNVSGEALGGSFRAFRSEFGHYRKNQVTSETFNLDVGVDQNIPNPFITPVNQVYTSGTSVSADFHSLKISEWNNNGPADQFKFKKDDDFDQSSERFVLKFAGDLASNFDVTNEDNTVIRDNPVQAELRVNLLQATPQFTDINAKNETLTNQSRTKRGSYIGFSSNKDFSLKSRGISYKVEDKNLKILNQSGNVVDYNATRVNYPKEGIGEVYTYNKDGVRYVYGLPIHTQNEKQLSFSVTEDNAKVESNGLIATPININDENINEDAKFKRGYESNTKYATQHLITQITSPDYIDRTFNGPSEDDFGSYTKFNYVQVAGGNNWYKYRTPYTGLNFDYGKLSDKRDDMGSLQYGEKELYFLHSIVSKTHVALFTLEDRADGEEAKINGDGVEAIIETDGSSNSALKKLTRIDLYALEDVVKLPGDAHEYYEPKEGAVPVKTVHMDYDYSLTKDLPNSENDSNSPDGDGKLTLKKLWFEYNGKKPSKISPYEFKYNYPTSSEVTYPDAYNGTDNSNRNFLNDFGDKFTEDQQNPNYDVLNTDRWGNYRSFGDLASRYEDLARFYPFTDQGPQQNFDPAAYLLKRIILPSGGEIHVQYEQHEYEYVQDKKTMQMLPLLDGVTPEDNEGKKAKRYYVDVNKLGLDFQSMNSVDKDFVVRELFAPMKTQRMYFKFLYTLVGNDSPDYKGSKSDYIEGFTAITGYGWDQNGAYLKFKGTGENTSTEHFFESGYDLPTSRFELPQKVCKDYYKTQRRGLIGDGNNPMDDAASIKDKAKTVLSIVGQVAGTSTICKKMKPSMSYVRLQTLGAKKGGSGVRVKRLLMYDAGIDGVPVLYGNEYEYGYEQVEGDLTIRHSYGVATNEPGNGRYESPLVQPLPRDAQSGADALLYGRDMYNQDGPIGEALMPGPSVGYSKVIVHNIHQGTTSTGYEVHEFLTAKDYPFKAEKTSINSKFSRPIGANRSEKGDGGTLGFGYSRNNPFMTQGYAFVKNDLHGKPKRMAKYAQGVAENEAPMAEELYFYTEPGEEVEIVDYSDIDETTGDVRRHTMKSLGRVSEMLAEIRQVEDITVSGSFGVDFTTGAFLPPPTGLPSIPVTANTTNDISFNLNEQVLNTHVINKIISYTSVMKKSINKADGVKHITQNLAFDENTGEPVITKTYDDFNQATINQDYMAPWIYPNMGQKAQNEKFKSGGMTYYNVAGTEYVQFEGTGNCGQSNMFAKGDFVELNDGIMTNNPLLYHVEEVDPTKDRLYIVKSALNDAASLSNSTAFNGVEVISSGNTNQLNAKVGNISRKFTDPDSRFYVAAAAKPTYTTNSFVDDLNSNIGGAIVSGSMILPNAYPYASVPLDGCFNSASFPTTCGGTNGEGVTVSNVEINVENVTGSEYKLTIHKITVSDGTNSETIECDANNMGTFISLNHSSDDYYQTTPSYSEELNYASASLNGTEVAWPFNFTDPASFPGTNSSNSSSDPDPDPNPTTGNPGPSLGLPGDAGTDCDNPPTPCLTGSLDGTRFITDAAGRVAQCSNQGGCSVFYLPFDGAFVTEYYAGSKGDGANVDPVYKLTGREARCNLAGLNCNEKVAGEFWGWRVTNPLTGNVVTSTSFAKDGYISFDIFPFIKQSGIQFADYYKVESVLSGNKNGTSPTAYRTYNVKLKKGAIYADVDVQSLKPFLTHSNIPSGTIAACKNSELDPWILNLGVEFDPTEDRFSPAYVYHNRTGNDRNLTSLIRSTVVCYEVIGGIENQDYEWLPVTSSLNNQYEHDFVLGIQSPGTYTVKFKLQSHQGICEDVTQILEYFPCEPCPGDLETLEYCLGSVNDEGLILTNPSDLVFKFKPTNEEFCQPKTDGSYECRWYFDNAQVSSDCDDLTLSVNPNLSGVIGMHEIRYESDNIYDPTDQFVKEWDVAIKDCRVPLIQSLGVAAVSCPDKQLDLTITPKIGAPNIPVTHYEWNFDDGQGFQQHGNSLTQEMMYAATDCDSKTIQVRGCNENGCGPISTTTYAGNGSIECHPACGCESRIYMSGLSDWQSNGGDFKDVVGEFVINAQTGIIGFQEAGCSRIYDFSCVKFCNVGLANVVPITENDVLSASAVTFADEWEYDKSDYYGGTSANLGTSNKFETGVLGNWRPANQFVFRDPLKGNQRNFEKGVFDLELFDWKTGQNNPNKWVKTSETTKYSPNGDPLEDRNVLDIYSTALYGYNHTLPIAVAQNSPSGSVLYESFETTYEGSQYFENGLEYAPINGEWSTEKSHTGKSAVKAIEDRWFDLGQVDIPSENSLIRIWISNKRNSDFNNEVKVRAEAKTTSDIHEYTMSRVVSAGEWSLYEAVLVAPTNQTGNASNIKIRINSISSSSGGGSGSGGSGDGSSLAIAAAAPDNTGGNTSGDNGNGNNTSSESIYFDDVRVQPMSSEMVCYVYDKQQRLTAVFDDQHFAMLYQYNSEGTLVRKLKETVEGIKTISETQYNTVGTTK